MTVDDVLEILLDVGVKECLVIGHITMYEISDELLFSHRESRFDKWVLVIMEPVTRNILKQWTEEDSPEEVESVIREERIKWELKQL